LKNIIITTGAELIAKAAMTAGVNFFAGYPITPASSIYSAMLRRLQAEGKLAIGASDEISAISMCIGASMRGAKTMTATSAPGLSLMVENIGYAFATETPVLIVLGQRLGPSTGSATQSAEGDISFVKNLISGGFHIPVFAISSIRDCFSTTINAINCSELLRTPVILLTEKDIAMSQTNIDFDELKRQETDTKIINRKYFNFEQASVYKTYDFDRSEEVPEFLPAGFGTSHRVVATASTHDKAGNLSKTSSEALSVIQHLSDKIEKRIDEYNSFSLDDTAGAETLVISFLGMSLIAQSAIKQARARNKKVKHLILRTLFPVPEKTITECLQGVRRVVVPEINLDGQYAKILAHLFKNQELISLTSLAGIIRPEKILEAIK
jgi:2-oxoglutarate ferredoxin oxidoreductase subunit alpha